jgi:uncharacterized membrane protein YeaQ/YmgE (transglycosylase-associated protein family)
LLTWHGFSRYSVRCASEKTGLDFAIQRCMAIILFLVFGLIVGLIARAVMPGRQNMGWVMTAVLGVVGSFVGGFLVSLVTDNRITDLNTAGLIGSVVGALLVLFIASRSGGRRALV